MSGTRFRDLHVWQKAKALAVQVYEVTKKGPLSSDFVMRDQMRRSAISICSNIAEGTERSKRCLCHSPCPPWRTAGERDDGDLLRAP